MLQFQWIDAFKRDLAFLPVTVQPLMRTLCIVIALCFGNSRN